MARTAYGADDFEAGTVIHDDWYSVGFDIGYVPIYDGPLGACWMRCCGDWEEDENTVDWSSLEDGGYLHWACRR